MRKTCRIVGGSLGETCLSQSGEAPSMPHTAVMQPCLSQCYRLHSYAKVHLKLFQNGSAGRIQRCQWHQLTSPSFTIYSLEISCMYRKHLNPVTPSHSSFPFLQTRPSLFNLLPDFTFFSCMLNCIQVFQVYESSSHCRWSSWGIRTLPIATLMKKEMIHHKFLSDVFLAAVEMNTETQTAASKLEGTLSRNKISPRDQRFYEDATRT